MIVAVGGGSATGLAKAIAMTDRPADHRRAHDVRGLGGDAGLGADLQGDVKTTGTDLAVLPKVVVYDATLTLTLPVDMSVASGLNALAHCVDALWAPSADPINAALAAEGIRVARGRPCPGSPPTPPSSTAASTPCTRPTSSAAAFASAGPALHHKICHVLGGKYNLPHAQTHATVLPYVLAFNGPAAPEAERRIAESFGTETAARGTAGPAPETERPARAARLRPQGGRDPRGRRRDPAVGPAVEPASRFRR